MKNIYIHKKEKAQILVDQIKNSCAESNLEEAWTHWCELFSLYNTPKSASDEQRMADCIELHSFLQQITNEEVYAITDYGKERYYAQTEEQITRKKEYIQLLKPIMANYLNAGNCYEFYWDYRDEYPAEKILEAYHKLSSEKTYEKNAFVYMLENYIYGLNLDEDTELLNLIGKEIGKRSDEKISKLYNEFGLDFNLLEEAGYNGIDINLEDLLDNTELHLNVMFATAQEQNYDMSSIVTTFGSWRTPCPNDVKDFDNALTYLIHQQGHTVEEVYNCYFANLQGFPYERQTNFIESVVDDIVNNSSDGCSELCVLTELTGWDIVTFFEAILNNQGYIKFGKNTELGIFNEWSGCGGLLDIQLEKDFVVPIDMIRDIQIEGAGIVNNNYTVDSVYSLIGSCWKDSFSFTEIGPELVSEDYVQCINKVNQMLSEGSNALIDLKKQ